MFCHKCGNKSPDEARFCHKCGAKVITDAAEASLDASDPQPTESSEPQYEYAHAQQEDMEYSDYPAYPVPSKPIEQDEDYSEYMDYMFFPAEQDASNSDIENKSDGENTAFIDYPIQPIKPKPVAPSSPYTEYPILKDSPTPGPATIKTPIKPPPPPIEPKRTEPQKQISPTRVDLTQAAPVKPSPTPPAPQKQAEFIPPPLSPAPQKQAEFIPPPPSPIPQRQPEIAPKPAEKQFIDSAPIEIIEPIMSAATVTPKPPEQPRPFDVNSSFIDFPPIQTAPSRPMEQQKPLDPPFIDFPAIPTIPPITPTPVEPRRQFTDALDFTAPPTGPRQLDTELLFMDDTNFARFTPHQAEPKPPDLSFIDNSPPFPSPMPSFGESIPQPITYRDPQPINKDFSDNVPDFNGFARNPVYETNDIVTHTPKKGKGPLIFAISTGIIFIAVVIVFLITILGGSVSNEDLAGTWTPAGYVLGPHNLRMQFNEDGTGRQYIFDTVHHSEADIIPFLWRIEGRNELILISTAPGGPSLLWPHESIIQISRRTGEPSLSFRPEGQSEWGEEYRRVRVQGDTEE